MQPKIFLIGFNKCGTTSFHDFFRANHISSVHWRANTLAIALYQNSHIRKLPLLHGVDQWSAYTDLICLPGSPWGFPNTDGYPLIEGCTYFRELDIDYPGSLFILNTRDPFSWVNSRLRHDGGRFATAYYQSLSPSDLGLCSDLREYWLKLWYNHHSSVLDYFSGSTNFLLYHLELSSVDMLREFLSPYYPTDSSTFPHSHRS